METKEDQLGTPGAEEGHIKEFSVLFLFLFFSYIQDLEAINLGIPTVMEKNKSLNENLFSLARGRERDSLVRQKTSI